jgi:hypothetical protein
MSKQRRHFAGTDKVAILKRHLIDKVPVSDLCDEYGLYPTRSTPGSRSSSRTSTPPSPTAAEP